MLLLSAGSFIWFEVSFIFSALSYNLESGAGDALIYDSLKEMGEEDKYMKISGNKEVFYQTAGIISFFLGGYLAAGSYDIAFVLTIVIGIITILQSITFVEPRIGRVKVEKNKENIFIKQLKDSIKVVISKPKIGFLLIITQIIMAFCACIFFYFQNYLKGDGFNEAQIGIIYALSSFASVIIATQVHRIEARIKEKGILILIPFITAWCIWGLALSRVNYVFLYY